MGAYFAKREMNLQQCQLRKLNYKIRSSMKTILIEASKAFTKYNSSLHQANSQYDLEYKVLLGFFPIFYVSTVL
jgi:hypothetical protein